jgi:hypothetical protein
MDQLAKEDIAAAAAAHRELGPHFDAAVAESLVERIGAEIDKRVDAKIADQGSPRRPARRARSGELSQPPYWASLALALGSMGIGIGATAAVLHMSQQLTPAGGMSNPISSGQIFLAVLIWVVIGVVNVSYNRRR